MKIQGFYRAFNILYDVIRKPLNIQQKETFYRLLFEDMYPPNDVVMFDNDAVRHITSGSTTLHRRAVKKLHTYEGFESLRQRIAQYCLPNLDDNGYVLSQLFQLCDEASNIPKEIKQQLRNSTTDRSEYHFSRAIAGILVCLNYSY